jgi:metal-responsive CopG/Arc/MetJ family transcriptional regulator
VYKEIKRVKERITITIDKELLDWLDKKINEKIFANRSHGVEFLINRKKEEKNE